MVRLGRIMSVGPRLLTSLRYQHMSILSVYTPYTDASLLRQQPLIDAQCSVITSMNCKLLKLVAM